MREHVSSVKPLIVEAVKSRPPGGAGATREQSAEPRKQFAIDYRIYRVCSCPSQKSNGVVSEVRQRITTNYEHVRRRHHAHECYRTAIYIKGNKKQFRIQPVTRLAHSGPG